MQSKEAMANALFNCLRIDFKVQMAYSFPTEKNSLENIMDYKCLGLL